MINTAKYFALLEKLSFKHALANENKTENGTHPNYLDENLRHFEKYVQLDVVQQLKELSSSLGVTEEDAVCESNIVNCYIIRLLHVLYTLTSNINFQSDAREDLISVAHLKLCIQTTQELSYYALRCQLHNDFYNSPVFKNVEQLADPPSTQLLQLSIQFFLRLLPIRQLHIANAMELVQRDLLASIISLRTQQLPEQQVSQLNAAISYLWHNESKADFFRHVLLLKATPQLSPPLAKLLHQQLLHKLSLQHGFASLIAALHTAAQNLDTTRSAEIVAQIVAQRGYSPRLQQQLIEQIFEYCRLQLTNVNSLICGVLSLRRLCELNATNQESIEKILTAHWKPLVEPEDLISGLIIWEQTELRDRLQLFQQLFCSSSVACLPSSLLKRFLPILLQLFEQLPAPDAVEERRAVSALICRCLDNRDAGEELPQLLQRLLNCQLEGNPAWQSLNPRIVINTQTMQVKVKQADTEQQDHSPSNTLCTLLMSDTNHALTSKVFLALLRLMLQQLNDTSVTIELLSTEAELAQFLQSKYQLKLQLLLALELFVGHEPLKAQLAQTQSKQFMQLLSELLQQRLSNQQPSVEADQTLVVSLMLLQEMLESSEQLQLSESTRQLLKPLQQLSAQTPNELVRNATQSLLSLLQGESLSTQQTPSAFQAARELIEQKKPHLQVYGIQLMVQGLRNKDAAFTSQCHRILALALETLKTNNESYTFLNCVRLFVALVHIMESEVLDLLSAEYLAETAQLDYRLVVGEAILKAAQEIGPLCYRYKDALLNCFLHGTKSPLDELRTSSYANLAQLCRLLSYQVHSFFQELLQLVNDELSFGRYLPAKRGALLVLAELLAGMESLLDYQELLLPIYRLLRAIESNEDCDPQMRQHAANGLKTLNEKCRQLLQLNSDPMEQMQREIKVLGINEPVARSSSKQRHILELN